MRIGKGLSVTAALLTCLFLFGCAGNDTAVTSEPPESGAITEDPPAAEVQEATQTKPSPAEDGEDGALEDEDNKSPIEVASPDGQSSAAPDSSGFVEDEGDGLTEAEARQQFYKELYDVTETFDAQHPTLMGLDMQSTLDAVQTRFGDPVDTYALPDESESASVYAYPGFSVGISNGYVLFVEVSTSAINPGLNGVRVGSTADDATAGIGEPTTRTEYVLTYKNNGVVLKFDIDPKNEIIQSIKLFPEE